METSAAERIGRSDSWFRRLGDGRIEINLVGNEAVAGLPIKLRASLPECAVDQALDFFEDVTGKRVEWEGRPPPPSGSRPIPGQTTIMEQLESLDGAD